MAGCANIRRPHYILLIFLGLSLPATAQTYSSFQGWCEQGNTPALVSGLQSTNTLQGSFPSCTVTVYPHGSTTPIATGQVFSDAGVTLLGNPFTANTNGSFLFFTLTSNFPLDVTTSGAGMASPYTYVNVGGTGGGGGGAVSCTPANSIQASNSSGGFTCTASVSLNTSTGTITTANITSPSLTAQTGTSGYQNLPDYVNMIKDCGVPSDHVTDATSAINNCFTAYAATGGQATRAFFFPRTNTAISSRGSCDYVASGTIVIPKNMFEPTLFGETGGTTIDTRICTTTTNTTGLLDNTSGATIRHLNFNGADGWVASNLATYVITGTADGVRVCGPQTVLDHVSALNYSRHGIALDSTLCFGGTTDSAQTSGSQLFYPFTNGNQGNGITVKGQDSNLIVIYGGESGLNQLFGFQDRAQYPATVIGLLTQANHNDVNAPVGGVTLTSCSVTNGTLTCTCSAACGIQSLDAINIAGSSNSAYNQKYEYTPATSTGLTATTFTMLTGDIGPAEGSSTTGGTVTHYPGARLWATANVYGGCCYASISGRGVWIGMYSEGNQPGPMVNSQLDQVGGAGTAGNTAYYYAGSGGFANTDTGYYSILGSIISIGSPTAKINWSQAQNVNPFTRRLMCNIFRPSGGISGGGGIDVGWSSQAGWCNGAAGGTTPEVIEMGRSTGLANTDGYWAFTDNDSVLTTAANTFLRLYDLTATTKSPGTVEFPNPNPVVFDTTPLIGTAAVPVTTTSPGVNQAVCIKSTGPPIVLGTCSTVVNSSGACTCN